MYQNFSREDREFLTAESDTLQLDAVRGLRKPCPLGEDTQQPATSGALAHCIHALPDTKQQ